jgi:hypothetical protein
MRGGCLLVERPGQQAVSIAFEGTVRRQWLKELGIKLIH